ncbi:hypothetical protein LPJ64_005153 [Coemansia asiatica]|uniref:Conserved oligomeric Golgi complex subunit 8 n=1 Tax=Coemansia asiatica TaxID=1052880 RepID=A0A9W7XHR6_9FUNG|nr:hypothetical protein LPJ64_005153 [Coemansia asiatica]
MTQQSQTDLESLYGSSFYGYGGGNLAADKDLPEYAQLCRRLFPTLLNHDEFEAGGPEREEALARYFKYLTSLPLSSLKMEPALLKGDLQRISNELTTLLLKESFRPNASAKETENDLAFSPGYEKTEDAYVSAFGAVSVMNKAAVSTASRLGSELVETQEIVGRLETVCGLFAHEMAELDQRARLIHQVLDKQDLITRIVELPRVMQMCVAGGYFEEAVEIAEHVRLTGDRLVADIGDAVQTLPGSKNEFRATAGSIDKLVGFVGMIQKHVQAEYEAMVLGLCRELSYTRLGSSVAAQTVQSRQQLGISGLGEPSGEASGFDGSVKRMSQVAKIVSILRSVGMFSEDELRMLYLRSRWSAWLATEESLSGFAPSVFQPPNTTLSPLAGATKRGEQEKSSSAAEVCAYLAKYIDGFFLWLAEVDMQYETLFAAKAGSDKTLANDPFADLALYSSQQFIHSVVPLLAQLTDASGISSLDSLVTSHARTLARRKIDFAVPVLVQTLHERAFVSIASGIEQAVASACESILAVERALLRDFAVSDGSLAAEQAWEQLAVPTRPSVELGDAFSVDIADGPIRFLSQYRVSPIGLLQYPLLSQLLHAFRDSLHSLRILVLAGDSADSDEVPILLSMASVVLESELIKLGESIASLCSKVESVGGRCKGAARDVCLAFVFGLVRHVAEIFEGIASLNEPMSYSDVGLDGGDLASALYSADVFSPLLRFIHKN